MHLDTKNICIVILAGGRGSRMNGQDKGLLNWQGKPLIEHVLQNLPTKHEEIFINANRNIDFYKKFGYKVLKDNINDFQGPLAGILSALESCNRKYLLSIPCDTPKPPKRFLKRLMQCLHKENAKVAICHDGKRLQPLFSLISCSLQTELEAFLDQGHRKVHDFFLQTHHVVCDFSDQADAFRNFNTFEDMQ